MIMITAEMPGVLAHRLKKELRDLLSKNMLFVRVRVITITHRKVVLVLEGSIPQHLVEKIVDIIKRYCLSYTVERLPPVATRV